MSQETERILGAKIYDARNLICFNQLSHVLGGRVVRLTELVDSDGSWSRRFVPLHSCTVAFLARHFNILRLNFSYSALGALLTWRPEES